MDKTHTAWTQSTGPTLSDFHANHCTFPYTPFSMQTGLPDSLPGLRVLTCRVWLTSQELHSLAGSIVNNITADIYVIYNKLDF